MMWRWPDGHNKNFPDDLIFYYENKNFANKIFMDTHLPKNRTV